MIVADASFVADYLLAAASLPDIARTIASQDRIAAPDLVEYEVANILRRHNIIGAMSDERATAALTAFRLMKIDFYPHGLLAERAWQLRHNITIYDACYVALAEFLEVPLYTTDKRLARTTGHSAEIVAL